MPQNIWVKPGSPETLLHDLLNGDATEGKFYDKKGEFDETYLRRMFGNGFVISSDVLSRQHEHTRKLFCITGMMQLHGGNISLQGRIPYLARRDLV